jgi:hypothetical protein
VIYKTVTHEEAVKVGNGDDVSVLVFTFIPVDFIIKDPGSARLDGAALTLF